MTGVCANRYGTPPRNAQSCRFRLPFEAYRRGQSIPRQSPQTNERNIFRYPRLILPMNH